MRVIISGYFMLFQGLVAAYFVQSQITENETFVSETAAIFTKHLI